MASNITLSAGVRQNLLSLQSTAALMALTQNRLATGKKVNSALDNPTNFFTSQSLSNRASDLNALLNSIGQAQKTLEAADKGLTSLTKLVESAKSIAKQARQAPGSSDVQLRRDHASTGNPTDEIDRRLRRRLPTRAPAAAATIRSTSPSTASTTHCRLHVGVRRHGTAHRPRLRSRPRSTAPRRSATPAQITASTPAAAASASTASNADVDFIDATSTAVRCRLSHQRVADRDIISTSLLDNIVRRRPAGPRP